MKENLKELLLKNFNMGVEMIENKLVNILKDLNDVVDIARKENLISVERISLHTISHIQTLLESIGKKEAGFSLKKLQ